MSVIHVAVLYRVNHFGIGEHPNVYNTEVAVHAYTKLVTQTSVQFQHVHYVTVFID